MSDNDMAFTSIDVCANGLTCPAPPYKDPAAGDVIICTSDGVELHIMKSQLLAVGLDFHGLLPQLRPADSGSKPKVTVQETSALWDKLLRVCLLDGELPYTLDDVSALLEVGHKYNIAGMPARMRYALLQPAFLKTEPIRVYLTAIAYGLQDTARTAARLTHKLPNLHHAAFDALQNVSGIHYHRLLAFRVDCGEAARKLTVPLKGDEVLPGWIAGTPAHWKLLSMTCLGTCAESCRTLRVVERDDKTVTIYVRIRDAWLVYLEKLGHMLKDQPNAAIASSPDLLEPVVASALGCPHCAKTIYRTCTTFSQIMEKKVEDALSTVQLAV